MAAYVFDTESTGLKEPVMIEAAWLKLSGIETLYELTGHYVQRFNPGKPIEPGALATHHILDEELTEQPPANSFQLPDDVEYIIGHNVDYDWQLIGKPDVKRICTLALSRSIWPSLGSHNQSAMLYFLSEDRVSTRLQLKEAHSALADVENCLRLLGHICEHLGSIASWEDLWQRSEQARIPKIMPFGKHKGEPIAKVPADYKRWLLNQSDIDPYLVQALKESAA